MATSVMTDLFRDGNSWPMPEGYDWTLEQQVVNRGYRFEEHKITTEDGYILTAFRVPGKLNEKRNPKKIK